MRQELEQAILFCIEALNNNNRANGSQEVEGNDKFVLSTLQKTSKTPYQGRNLGIGEFGHEDYRKSFEDMMERVGKESITYSLAWLDALLTLFDFANYDETEMLEFAKKIMNDNIMFNHVMKHIITNCVVLNDIEAAERFIPHFKKTTIFKKEEDNLDKGYLIILRYFAMKGDVENFFKYFKKSKPSANRNEVTESKILLVHNYALQHKLEDAMKLCTHKNLGDKYYFNVLNAYAEQGKYQEIKAIFEQYPELKQPEAETELKILVGAYQNAKKKGFDIDDDFDILFDRAKKVDRKLRWGDFKLQDSILLDLGLASRDNAERLTKCRKAIKNNIIKKELQVMSKTS